MIKANVKLAAKYFPKEKKDREKIDTAKSGDTRKNNIVLMDAFTAWTGLDSFRKMAERNKMYTFSDQWGDRIPNPDGPGSITERRNILNQGSIPLQNNRIRGIARSVIGVFQSMQTEPVCTARDRDEQSDGEMMSATLQYVYQRNKLWGLDSNCLLYFIVTGVGAFKSTWGWRNGSMDVWDNLVNPNRLFFDNHMQDPRHWDCHLIGEIHDVGLYDVMAQFSHGSREKAEEIRRIYAGCNRERTIAYVDNLRENLRNHLDFFIPTDETRCRVIEIWKKESKERLLVHDALTGEFYKAELEDERKLTQENKIRKADQAAQGIAPKDMKLIKFVWFIDNYWYYYYMSPQGDVLDEGETPFWHESHPYSFKVYPFYDGQVFPFVSDFIDQNRYINRLITLQDFVIRSSAKGVLAVPDDLPDGWPIERYASEWARYNGVILFKAKPGVPLPQQIVSNVSQLGITDMLSIQLKLLEDISGVQGALQGQAPKAGTPASLYMQQTQNSSTSLTEIFEAFRELREERDMKNMKLIQQFYTEPRYINISGNSAQGKRMVYNPQKVRNAEFDLSITESTSTPAYRMVMNDFLMQIYNTGQISLEEVLQNGAFPFADKLLQSIKARGGQIGAGNVAPEGGQVVPQDIGQQVMQGTSPIVQQMLTRKAA